MTDETFDHPDVIVCPHGPLLIRGEHSIEDSDGRVHRTSRAVSAICRCGKSSQEPWCDGTHKVIPRGVSSAGG